MIEKEKIEKKELARDINALVASEKLFQQYRELVNAGFSESQALIYLSNLIGYITVNNKNDRHRH